MWSIILGLPIYYLTCCWIRWQITKHYERHFKFMDWEDILEGWEYMPITGAPNLYRSIVIGVPVALIMIGLLRIFGVF